MDSRYVKYQGRYKKKAPQRADHLEPHRWKPGESGNKTGRPRGVISLVEELKKYLRRNPEDVASIIEALVKQGKIGNMTATKEMLERIDGKVVEKHELAGELPIFLQFVPASQVLEIEGEKPKQLEEGKD